jgi:hypothetical protein
MWFLSSSNRHTERPIARIDSGCAFQHDIMLAVIRERDIDGQEFTEKVGTRSDAERGF